jgi:hypothetical protein
MGKKFNPKQSFDSPQQAIDLCKKRKDPIEAAKQIVSENIDMGEYGFASEVVALIETLENY